MSTECFIYWRKDVPKADNGDMFANVHLLVGYNQSYITDLQEMAAELRKTFPQATDDQIRTGHVTRSSFYDRFTIITWDGHIPKGKYPGWKQVRKGHAEYGWL